MSGDAITEAIELLRSRREELRAEIERINAAIAKLTPPEVKRERATSAKKLLEGLATGIAAASEAQSAMSVRSLVVALTEEAPRLWTSREIVDEIERRGLPQKVTNLAAAVRTAIWGLERGGQIARIGDSIVATKYVNDPGIAGAVQQSAITKGA